jgi:hypothetical protein
MGVQNDFKRIFKTPSKECLKHLEKSVQNTLQEVFIALSKKYS